ncbi:GTPase activating protein of Rab-like GTPase [Trypanosoma theileri]|uniref:Alternative oxidase n=1 Tax=Trypanosoma theileri TaxID=67003 RepID=A0A1X0P0D1_9TRYP|nr:GTPase activating protein of Rab-like GTPase [Trypanosoma theileri]ORC90372.1 GTPase activating protein of Rab-like GTPase [Trypanosoma theileri]
MQRIFVARTVAAASCLRRSPAVALLISTRQSSSSSSSSSGNSSNSNNNSSESNNKNDSKERETKQSSANTSKDESHKSSLYINFMGSSSRFTFASPISTLADINALEREQLTHFPPERLNDYCCIYLVKLLRWCSDKLFRERYLHRATMLKTIAPVAPFSGALVMYLRMMFKKKSPVSITGKGGYADEVRGLLAQAESHASHSHFLMCVSEITYIERVAVLFLQSIHFTIFMILFLLYPRMAFRLLGYLGEESVVIWTHMINDIDLGKVSERMVPKEAIDYWGLHGFKPAVAGEMKDSSSTEDEGKENKTETQQSLEKEEQQKEEDVSSELITLRDVILLLRSDEMVWRDVCHRAASDVDQTQSKEKSFFSSFFL